MATRAISAGDLIRDNLGRKGVAVEPSRRPAKGWLALQNDRRMRRARGPWWHVCVLGGGGILVPESLARRIKRATVDDLVAIMDGYDASGGQAILRDLMDKVRRAGAAKRPK